MRIFVGGNGRSGTSWFANMVAENEKLKYFHEPFMVKFDHDPFGLLTKKLVATLEFPNRDYIIECISKAIKIIPDFVFKDFWSLYYTKELHDDFDFKIIYIIRNPASWFASAFKLNNGMHFYDFIGNPTVMKSVRPYLDHIYSRTDKDWLGWMSWCIRYTTLRNSGVGDWITHEELCLNTERAFEKVGLKLTQAGKRFFSQQNKPNNKAYSRIRDTKNEPFKYFGKFIKLEEMKKAMEPFGVLDWDYWNWDERFCLRNIKQ